MNVQHRRAVAVIRVECTAEVHSSCVRQRVFHFVLMPQTLYEQPGPFNDLGYRTTARAAAEFAFTLAVGGCNCCNCAGSGCADRFGRSWVRIAAAKRNAFVA